jgi:hypothetical protein
MSNPTLKRGVDLYENYNKIFSINILSLKGFFSSNPSEGFKPSEG